MALIKRTDQHVSHPADGYIGVKTIHHKSNGSTMLSVIEASISSIGSSYVAPPHVCTNAEEVVYVLKGDFKFSYDGAEGKLSDGDCICYPKGVLRSYESLSTLGGGLLFISPHPQPHWLRKPDRAIKSSNVGPKPLDESSVYRTSGWDNHLEGVARQNFCSPAIGADSTFANKIRIGPGAVVPIHYHPEDDVSLICLDGRIVFMYEDTSLGADKGDALLVEAGMVHGVKNESSEDAYFLEIYATDAPEYVYTNQDGLDKSNFLRLRPPKKRRVRGGS